MTEFTIHYNHGKGKMTLNLEVFFERKESGRFVHTIKPEIYKLFKLVNEWCDEEKVVFLLKWFREHDCKDLADYYQSKYQK